MRDAREDMERAAARLLARAGEDPPAALAEEFTAMLVAAIGETAATRIFDGQIAPAAAVAGRALGVGDVAPDFTLPNAFGAPARLADRLREGPVVLSFYRGNWCPYCNLELRALQGSLPALRARAAALVAVSPEPPDQSLSTTEKLALDFDVLSDRGNEVARRFGLVYTVSAEARELLRSFGIDVGAHNGADRWELPLTATYVIDRDHYILFAHLEPDYRRRIDPRDVVAALDRLGGSAG